MSKFLNSKYNSLIPYDTSEEIESMNGYIKLNTNEPPFPPSPKAIKFAHEAAKNLNFYSDPECRLLAEKISELLDIKTSEIVFGTGSDEILNFIFMGFCENGAAFPDITYSFYKILADYNSVDYIKIPLRDFRIFPEDFSDMKCRTLFVANPNAPTGIALNLNDIEKIIAQNPESLVVIDEAYVDFGTESAKNLIHKYENLIVTRTFSKSRSLAGARLGFGIACEKLANDMRTIKNTITPYNINAMTQAAGLGALNDEIYTQKNIAEIIKVREHTKKELEKLNFEVLDSATNFLFARHESVKGEMIFNELKKRGIMIRHFESPEKISDFNRITIGTDEQMNKLIKSLREFLR